MMNRFFALVLLSGILLPSAIHSQNTSPAPAKGQEKFTNKPKLIRGPYLQVATDTSMVIRWRTDALSRSRVRYGYAVNNLDKTVDNISLSTEHEMKLTGLKPGTKYYYSIGTLKDTLQYGADNYFSTFPAKGKEGAYKIGVFGDCGYLSVNQANVRDQFIKYLGNNDLNAWILLGDNAYNDGNDMEYQAKFFTPYKDILLKKYPVFPSPGNHDYHDADFTANYAQKTHEVPYYQNFSMPVSGEAGGVPSGNPAFYSFDLGNIHFISLDSYGMEESKYFLWDTMGPQVQWLKKDLAANRNKGWVVAYWHYPPYSKGTHDSDEDGIMTGVRENLLRIFERYEVDLIICGHSHVYERSKMMTGHYGKSESFDAAKHNVSNSSGLYNGSTNSAPYIKESGAEKGMVYIVSGSSAYVGKSYPDWPHRAMYYSNDKDAGAGILEVNENRLDFKWICADGVIRDQFTMMKNVNKKTVIRSKKGEKITLTASFVVDAYKWDKTKETNRSIEVTPPVGKTKYIVKDVFNNLQDVFEVIVTK
ncbi:MAG: purple acid phosphatase [Chitinophagaceae bacterium]|nr:purple acid phosphatase [Chitinophagaceae bacterium]